MFIALAGQDRTKASAIFFEGSLDATASAVALGPLIAASRSTPLRGFPDYYLVMPGDCLGAWENRGKRIGRWERHMGYLREGRIDPIA